jgi:hypothetical protein
LRVSFQPLGVRVRERASSFKSPEDQLVWAFGRDVDLIPQGLSAPPDLGVDQLMTLLAGLLEIGGMGSFEKSKGVAAR